MKTEKTAGTPGLPAKVAPNRYRHRLNGTYCGGKKIAGKRTIHALGTANRTTANIALREWLAALGKTDPENPDLNLATLGGRFLAARTPSG